MGIEKKEKGERISERIKRIKRRGCVELE